MDLFTLVIAILFLQVWGSENPLHRDEWLGHWQAYLSHHFSLAAPWLFAATVGLPVLAMALLLGVVGATSYWLLLPLGIGLLLYSFGRGEFAEIIYDYTHACSIGDWQEGLARARRIGVDADSVAPDDWASLHNMVLQQAAYRGFERMFAVLFWFFVLGPLGALLYRLVFLYCQRQEQADTQADTLLWLLEWPAVRVLGLSFALTGNFVGCMGQWRASVFCAVSSTKAVIGQSVLGALTVDETLEQTCEVTRKELQLLEGLYRRSLWLWLAVAAIFIIFA